MSCSLAIQNLRVETALGILWIEACAEGLHKLNLEKIKHDTNLPLYSEVKTADTWNGGQMNEHMKFAVRYLTEYFGDGLRDSKMFLPDVCCLKKMKNQSFTLRCWDTLMKTVGVGETVSYGELAKRTGSDNAGRAVGQTMKNNPIILVIPCHRVIRSDGTLGHYGPSDDLKQRLIERERKLCPH